MKGKALIIEDDNDLVEVLILHVQEMGYELDRESNGRTGLERALCRNYSFILLDLSLPGLNGIEVCKRIRAESDTPILILTGSASETEKVLTLELGADDYLTKPFSPRELKARIGAVLRRSGVSEEAESQVISVEKLSIDLDRRKVFYDGKEKILTAFEFDILATLAQQPGRALSRSQICYYLYGSETEGSDHNISALVNRIRSKIEPDPSSPRFVQTVRGIGYRFGE